MDAVRLRQIGEFLFERENWRVSMAKYLGVTESTIYRWLRTGEVPRMAKIALLQSFQNGLLKEDEVVNG